jgi:hypothetical protein
MWREPVLLADASLQDVTDAAKRHELEDARLKLQNDVRTTLLQAWRWWIALATFFILVWWLVPPLLYRHTGTAKDAKVKAITDTRTALLAGLIGVSALLTFWLNSRVYRITARTFEVTEQGQITERYSKAIEQLGADKLDVRLGAIYALERIATDS